jgi:hypothetical protein
VPSAACACGVQERRHERGDRGTEDDVDLHDVAYSAISVPRMNAWPAPQSFEHSKDVLSGLRRHEGDRRNALAAFGNRDVDVGSDDSKPVVRVVTPQTDFDRGACVHAKFGGGEAEALDEDVDHLRLLLTGNGKRGAGGCGNRTGQDHQDSQPREDPCH